MIEGIFILGKLFLWIEGSTQAISTFTFTHLAEAFIQSNLMYSGYTFFISMCVPGNWTHNLLQCSTTEPQKHNIYNIIDLIGQ